MFVPNFKILGPVVPEKSMMKKRNSHTQTTNVSEKTNTIYPYILAISQLDTVFSEKTDVPQH